MIEGLPNLFVIGAPRCATSALVTALGTNPEVGVAEVKEPHFFTWQLEQSPAWACRSLEDYRALYRDCQHKRFRIDGSTWYLFRSRVAHSIREACPDARVLAVLRHPIDRAYSAWCFNRANGWEAESSFERAIEQDLRGDRVNESWDNQYLRVGAYAQQVRAWQSVFSAAQLKIVPFEQLINKDGAVLEGIHAWLGLNTSGATSNALRQQNESRISAYPISLKMVRSVWRALLPASVRRRAHHRLRPAFDRVFYEKPEPLNHALRRSLAESLRADIVSLAEVSGIDFEEIWLDQHEHDHE